MTLTLAVAGAFLQGCFKFGASIFTEAKDSEEADDKTASNDKQEVFGADFINIAFNEKTKGNVCEDTAATISARDRCWL